MKKLTKNDFIIKANKIHNNKYDYSKIIYINSRTAIKITCRKHGDFLQRPASHLYGQGCSVCGYNKSHKNTTYTTEDFIKKANKIHHNRYDYSLVEYKNTKTKICIICKQHGKFYQIPNNHINGLGCKKCSKKYKYTTQEFIENSKKIHNTLYNYSDTKYINSKTKVEIICKKHGKFLQNPYEHMIGHGCPYCITDKLLGNYNEGYFKKFSKNKNLNAVIYFIKLNYLSEVFYKIGISTNFKTRNGFNPYKKNIILIKKLNLYDAFLLEQKILREFKKYKYIPKYNFGGKNECFNFSNKNSKEIKEIINE